MALSGFEDLAAGDLDRPGLLSIVVQGGLLSSNVLQVARHVQHWRRLFPAAEIILAISVTDLFEHDDAGETSFGRFASVHRADGQMRAATTILEQCCNSIVFGEAALPLPPIKADSSALNNINLQIAAAKAGLSVATGQFVLRIRSDMVFLTRDFVEQYRAAIQVPPGDARVFTQRVMISWLYTLNPFTLERLPFHFSDWFNFGLREDVAKLWRVPPMSLADSLHFTTSPHPKHSNARERLFKVRVAVEQHVVFEAFRHHFPDLRLDAHNDPTSVDRSLDILLDNFCLCDLKAANCHFEKYSAEFTNHEKLVHCITPEDWWAMASARDADHRQILTRKLAQHATCNVKECSIFLEAARLSTNVGFHLNEQIVSTSDRGVITYGPYLSLNPGRYLATLKLLVAEGSGALVLKITKDAGNTILAERRFDISDNLNADPTLAFRIVDLDVKDVEFVCSVDGLKGVAVAGVLVGSDVETAPDPPRRFRFRPGV